MKKIHSRAMRGVIDDEQHEAQADYVLQLLAREQAKIDRETGKVKWFHAEKGYGWIARGDGKPDIHCHISNIIYPASKILVAGDAVLFSVTTGKKGLTAKYVERVNQPAYITDD